MPQMWKVKHLSGGLYSIRPMHKLDMGLSAPSSDVKLTEIGTTDSLSGIATNSRWKIYYNGSGYVLQCEGSTAKTLAPVSNSTSVNTYVDAHSFSETSTVQRWTLTRIASPPEGILVYNSADGSVITQPGSHTVYVGVGQTKTVSQLFLDIAIYGGDVNSQEIDLSSGNSTIATVNSSSDSVTGRISGTTSFLVKSHEDSSISTEVRIRVTENNFYIRSYYDEFFPATGRVQLIDDAVILADQAFTHQFNVSIIIDGAPVEDDFAPLVGCETGENNPCGPNCGSDGEHHKDVARIYETLAAYQSKDNQISVLWTHRNGGVYCDRVGGHSTYDSNTYAVTHNGNPGILMMRQMGSDAESYAAFMGIVLSHELGHVFGYQGEAYDITGHDTAGWHCVMEAPDAYEYQNVLFYIQILAQNRDAFCSSCETVLDDLTELTFDVVTD